MCGCEEALTYTLTRQSFASTAMTLFNSFGWRPIRPARSSSFRLQTTVSQLLYAHKRESAREKWASVLVTTYTGYLANWSMIIVYFGS